MRGYPDPVVSDGNAKIGGIDVSVRNIRIDDYIGSGANAFVFGGVDEMLDRPVAVKVFAPRTDRSESASVKRIDQVLQECRKLARLKHENIVPIYAADTLSSGWIYAVMERSSGVPLADIRDQLTGDSRRMMIWHAVYKGLSAAERQGIYHGDLHNGNVLVTQSGLDAEVIDFGTSVLSGAGKSLKRHARLVNRFALELLPELRQYLTPLDMALVDSRYATHVVNRWVDIAGKIQRLEARLPTGPREQLALEVGHIGRETFTNHTDLFLTVSRGLRRIGVDDNLLDVFNDEFELYRMHLTR